MTKKQVEQPDDLRAALAEIDEEQAGLGRSDQLLEKAALVGWFDLDWLEKHAAGLTKAKSKVLGLCEPLDSSGESWRLQASAREQVLRGLTSAPARLRRRLKESTPLADDAAGIALQACLRSGSDPRDVPLEGLFEASTWLHGNQQVQSPDPREVRRRLSWDRLQERLKTRVELFVGRSAELERLDTFIDKPASGTLPIPVLSVFGIGGIGKSALIGRLLHERLQRSPVQSSSPLIFYLDFDRFSAASVDLLELTFELTRLLAFQLPEAAADLDAERKRAQKAVVGSSLDDAAASSYSFQSFSHGKETISFAGEDLMEGLFRSFDSLGLRTRRLILLFDTVETLQVASLDGLNRLAKWILGLTHTFFDVRVILSGRVAVEIAETDFAPPEQVRVDELPADEAEKLLTALGMKTEAAVPIVAEFGGNPLILRLVVQLADRNGLDLTELLEDSADEIVDRELIQGMLYRRILKHVDDDRVRELAHPGLAVRRVTAELIRDVLAPVCLEKSLAKGEHEKIYNALAQQVWLVEPAPDGFGVLHRSDLRKLTMKLIARDPREAKRLEEVHRRAVEYYEIGNGRDAPYASREALYHRFMLGGDALPDLDESMALAARDAIGQNFDELPRASQVALRAALNQAVTVEEALTLTHDLWVQFVTKRGNELAERESFAEALELFEKRSLPSGMPTPPWKAAALDALARWDELFDLLGVDIDELMQRRESIRSAIMHELPLPADALTGSSPWGRLCAWMAAGLKCGRLFPEYERVAPLLEALPARASEPAVITVKQYAIRASWPLANDQPVHFESWELLKSPEAAYELVNYLQVLGRHDTFRPVRAQFSPSDIWLRMIHGMAGPVAQSPLAGLLAEIRTAPPEQKTMGRYLGQWSGAFEDAWTDAFARDAIPSAARVALLMIHDFPEFRVPARTAILAAFQPIASLRELVLGFAPILPVIPWDLTEEGIDRAISEPRDFATNFIAFVDRCQLLYGFLGYAELCADQPAGIAAVRQGMERWFVPSEAEIYGRRELLPMVGARRPLE